MSHFISGLITVAAIVTVAIIGNPTAAAPTPAVHIQEVSK